MSQTWAAAIDNCRVIHRGSPDSGLAVAEDGVRRSLYLDNDTLQSCMLMNDPNGLYLEYSQAMMCALLFRPEPADVLLIGLGGGSIVKFLLEYCPDARIDVAEIDPEVVAVAREYFLLPECSRLRIMSAPGEEVVAGQKAAGSSYDLILLDAFDESGPARALLEPGFLENCRDLLTTNGVFAMNLWNRPRDDFPGNLAALEKVFGERINKLLLANANSNAIVFGFNQVPPVKNLMQLKPASRDLGRRTGVNFMRWLRQLYWQNIS
jgi:spermidine synthase